MIKDAELEDLKTVFVDDYEKYIEMGTIDWEAVSTYEQLPDWFIKKHINDINFLCISRCHVLTDEFLLKFRKEVNWNQISMYRKLSEETIRNFASYVDWVFISTYQKLSEKFIDEFKDYVSWEHISWCQMLSESFIEKHWQYLSWDGIAIRQKLSPEFIYKWKDKFYIKNILPYQKVSDDYIKYVKEEAPELLYLTDDNWIYKSAEEKKQAVVDTGEYECYDDYFIAYKAVRTDGYSFYNLQYKYEKGGIYESWCDCSDKDDSFGLNVGTNDYAQEYGLFSNNENYKILRCKVKYEDVGRVIDECEKVRCFKIEILD